MDAWYYLWLWLWSLWDAYKAESSYITPWLAPLATVIAAVLTLIVGYKVASAAIDQAETARDRHEAQTKADRQRRITESFAKAVEHLGSREPQVCLGGIYTLERLSQESKSDYWPIMEILTGFVRERARWKDDTALPQEIPPRYHQVEGPYESSHRLSTEIAAVLTVIMRRNAENRERERREKWKLDLSFTDLRGAVLYNAHLENSYLMGTHLDEAYLDGTHLEMANLTGAHLRQANLFSVHLEGARFVRAHLEGANIYGGTLVGEIDGEGTVGVNFATAHLEAATFTGVDMGAVNLDRAHLHGADLSKVHKLRQDQIDHAYGDSETRLPPGLTKPDHWK